MAPVKTRDEGPVGPGIGRISSVVRDLDRHHRVSPNGQMGGCRKISTPNLQRRHEECSMQPAGLGTSQRLQNDHFEMAACSPRAIPANHQAATVQRISEEGGQLKPRKGRRAKATCIWTKLGLCHCTIKITLNLLSLIPYSQLTSQSDLHDDYTTSYQHQHEPSSALLTGTGLPASTQRPSWRRFADCQI